MTEHHIKMPKRRFKGFTGEWEREYLKDLGIFFKGSGISKTDLSDEGYSCILYGELYTKYNEVIKDVQSKTNIELNNPVIGKVNDILIPSSCETAIDIATASCLQVDGVLLGGDLNIFRPHNVNGIFLSYQLGSSKKMEIAKMAQGASVVHVYNEQLKDLVVDIPSLEEQQKIGEFFSELDERIELQKSKIEKMTSLKKAYLSEMFPAEGETTPKRRFKGFTGEWEEKNFQEVYSNIPTKPYQIKTSEVLEQGEYEVVDQGKERVCGYSNNHEKLFHNLPIIIYGDHTTYIKFRDEKFIIGADGTKLLGNKNTENDLKFLFYALEFNNITPEGYKRHFSILKEIELYIPSLEEQQKIGEFFSELDEMIELHEEKLKKLQDLKQAYLNELLV